LATAASPHGIPTSLSLDTYSIWQLGILFHLGASQFTTMPPRYWLLVAITFEEFFAALHLGIGTVFNFEPCASLPLRDVGSEAVLGYNSFQVHLADTLKQRRTASLDVVGIAQSGCRRKPRQQASKFVLSISDLSERKSLPSDINKSKA
jgi:hypothetical protein